ncbi:hypothetical protein R1flu_025939 [Riccia fluitans]|uniref:ATP-dependent Clp protease proteolytic subunit n=1 Tax=Riccia fluitans TaxID=41844 RepID=A0ABD1XZC9_9MARC
MANAVAMASLVTMPADRLYKQATSFQEKVQNSLRIRGDRSGACRAQVTMMPIGTPKVPYRTPQEGGWQWVDIWNVLYRERIIFIGQYIDEEFGNQVLATMLYLDSIDNTKPLYLYLNSPGGDMTPCMSIYDTIQSIKSEVGTLALGYAYNNAGLLLSAGAKGLRVAMPMTRIALQSPSGAARGTAADIQNEAKELSRVRNYIFSEVSKKTGQPLEKVTKDLSRIKRRDQELDLAELVSDSRLWEFLHICTLFVISQGYLIKPFRE